MCPRYLHEILYSVFKIRYNSFKMFVCLFCYLWLSNQKPGNARLHMHLFFLLYPYLHCVRKKQVISLQLLYKTVLYMYFNGSSKDLRKEIQKKHSSGLRRYIDSRCIIVDEEPKGAPTFPWTWNLAFQKERSFTSLPPV